MYMRNSEAVNLNSPLREIYEAPSQVVDQLFLEYEAHNSRAMIAVNFSVAVTYNGTTYDGVVFDGKEKDL